MEGLAKMNKLVEQDPNPQIQITYALKRGLGALTSKYRTNYPHILEPDIACKKEADEVIASFLKRNDIDFSRLSTFKDQASRQKRKFIALLNSFFRASKVQEGDSCLKGLDQVWVASLRRD
jgi:hypothetical protein